MRLVLAIGTCAVLGALRLSAQLPDGGRQAFDARCAGCHGSDGAGGEHAPDIVDPSDQAGPETRAQTVARLHDVITHGIPGGGMPAFTLSRRELDAIATYVVELRAPASEHPPAGDVAAGRAFFFGRGQC